MDVTFALMKIVHFSSGLGNQVFFYLFCRYLQKKYPKQKVYGYYNKRWLKKHNGLELDKVFDVYLPPHTKLRDIVAWLCRKLNGIGVKGLKATDSCFSESAVYFDGYYHDTKFIQDFLSELKFRDFYLDNTNRGLKEKILTSNSVAIHIRRGDYLLPEIDKMFGGICTDEYYRKAINIVKEKWESPTFFVFSNDIEWVREHLPLDDAFYVTNNTGDNSYLDMYLMSLCKGDIIANSTFSYWGAIMNRNNPVVIYPQKWNNLYTPNMFPVKWIGL